MDQSSDVTVLFVDEDPDFLDLATRLLTLESDRIDLVPEASPGSVLDRIENLDVDCVVSDYKMTELDGIELLARVRETHPDLPFILFTGKGTEQVASDAMAAGATDYIVKTGSPEQYTVLASRVENAVERRRTEDRGRQQQRVASLVRTVTRELIGETTREGIERTVCRELAAVDQYALVKIYTSTSAESPLKLRTWDANEDTAVDPEGLIEAPGDENQSPEQQVYGTGEAMVIEDVGDGPVTDAVGDRSVAEGWRSIAEEAGIGSGIVVPIRYAELPYGVMSIYAGRSGVFGGVERTVIEELGEFVGFLLNTVELRRGMFSPTMTEVGLTVRDTSSRLIRLAESIRAPVALDRVVRRDDGTFTLSIVVDSDDLNAEHTRGIIEETLHPETVKTAGAIDGTRRWTVVTDRCPVAHFADRGIRFKEMTVVDGRGHITLEAPQGFDVRDIVETAELRFEEVELTARRRRADQQPSEPPLSGVVETLTPRQLEVLEVAYENGFFEWPRAMNTEEIASLLDISQPALSRHLRNIQRTVAESLVDAMAEAPTAE